MSKKLSQEQLLSIAKEQGDAPSWLSIEGFSVISKGYLLPGETPKTAWERVTSGIVRTYIGDERADRVFSYLWKGWLGLASPVFSNLNTTRGLPISCYSIHVEDSIDGIADSNKELMLLGKHGGGVGVFWGGVRPRGALIQNGANGTSEGVIPFMHLQDSATLATSQGQTRRAASAAYLPIEHGDSEEFIRMRKPSGDVSRQNLNIHHGVTITDDFMKSLKDSSHPKCKHNRELWKEMLKTRLETGEPYIMFYDNVNKNAPECYKANNLKVSTSNLCLAKDTLVLTKEFGGVRIDELVGKEVTIFDGKDWVKNSSFRKTQGSAKLYRIHLSDGSYVDSTENHRWFAAPESLRVSEALKKKDGFKELTTSGLKPEMKLSFHMEEEGSGGVKAESAYLKGFLIAEGTRAEVSQTSSEYKPLLWIYEPKKGCIDRLIKSLEETKPSDGLRSDSSFDIRVGDEWKNGREPLVGLSSRRSLINWCDEYKSSFPQEVFSWSRESKLEFIAGLFDGDGTYMQARGGYQIASIHRSFLAELQQLLKGLGVRSSIGLMREAGFTDFNDGYGEYETQDCYRLTISSYFAHKLSEIVSFSRLSQYSLKAPNRYCADFSRIVSIEELVGEHEVYCTTVPSTTKFALANGLMTGNCSEILLNTDNNHSFVCCLSSVNLDKYDEWKSDKNFISDCVWFLDAVMEEFINKAKNIKGFERAVRFAEKSRALGLGVLGWHSLLQKKNLPFDCFDSMMLNTEIFRKMKLETTAASQELAKEKGEPEWCKGFGIRNSHTMALAPTATNSVISGGVSPGIEPIIANAFLQKTAKGTFMKRNEYLTPVLEKYGQNNDDVWKSIAMNNGSVLHLDFLSDHEKEVFKTAYEINQMAIVKQAASRQKYIDQGQSLNIFVPCSVNAKDYHDLHYLAWEQGIRCLYYSRSTSAMSNSTKSNIDKNICKACEG